MASVISRTNTAKRLSLSVGNAKGLALGYGTFLVCSPTGDLSDPAYVEAFSIRVPLTITVEELKEKIVSQSSSTATPIPRDLIYDINVYSGDRTLLKNGTRLREYSSDVRSSSIIPLPKGYRGILMVTQKSLVGASREN